MNIQESFYTYTSKEIGKNTYLENFVGIFLFLLTAFKENFYKDFEDKIYPIYADIISFIDNPHCSCRLKIAAYIEEHYLEMYPLVENWLKNYKNLESYNEEYDKLLLSIFEKMKERDHKISEAKKFKGEPENAVGHYMLGKIVTISDTPEEFHKLISFLKENDYYYNNMSVVKHDNNQIKIYFS